MKVLIRTDASLQIGTGHLMRCLTLADALVEQGASVQFICRELPGNLIEMIESKGYGVFVLHSPKTSRPGCFKAEANLFHSDWLGVSQKQDALECKVFIEKIHPDWLIVDHYAIDKHWQMDLSSDYKKLMVIDDLGDRQHICDLLLDQNYGSTVEKYQPLVPLTCKVLAGVQYALLRPEFAQWRDISLKRRAVTKFRKILITLGGVDQNNITGQVLEVLNQCSLPQEIEITVVMGATAPHLNSIKAQLKTVSYVSQVLVNITNMAEIMANADLAIGATGATTWERCCLGVPSIQMVIAENQKETSQALAKNNVVQIINKPSDLIGLMNSPLSWMAELTSKSAKVCDGQGCLKVAELLFAVFKK